MYKFTIEYYFERYHTGALNYNSKRQGRVFANNRSEAIAKIKEIDDNYIGAANIEYEEVRGKEE